MSVSENYISVPPIACDVPEPVPIAPRSTSTVGQTFLNLFGNHVCRGIKDEIVSRSKHWTSDWLDGIADYKSSQKLLSTTWFLYFSCLLPAIAFGTLNEANSAGYFTVCKTIIAQGIGGIIFSAASTQPLVILLSTAPLALIIKVTHAISVNMNVDFAVLYAWVGLFNGIFLILFSVSNIADVFLHYTSPFLIIQMVQRSPCYR